MQGWVEELGLAREIKHMRVPHRFVSHNLVTTRTVNKSEREQYDESFPSHLLVAVIGDDLVIIVLQIKFNILSS